MFGPGRMLVGCDVQSVIQIGDVKDILLSTLNGVEVPHVLVIGPNRTSAYGSFDEWPDVCSIVLRNASSARFILV